MSIFNENEDERIIDIFEQEEDIQNSPKLFEDLDELNFIKNEKEESHSSFIISDKTNPLFINNENFINYFMQIDYNTPLAKEKNNSSQSNSGNPPVETYKEENIKENLLKKLKRDKKKEYGIITDNLTGITYKEEEDPISYRKAKKRIQNRESALRMKKLKENNSNRIEEEINRLKDYNIKLINENISLKKEKMFLIEQIKFMQKIIKESNLEFKLKNNIDNDNKNNIFNENKNKEPVFYYEGSKQKIKGKLFNVFVVCILSIVYIVGECSYDENGGNFKKDRNTEHGMKLNSIKNNGNKNFGI